MTHFIAERFVQSTGLSLGKTRMRNFIAKPFASAFLVAPTAAGQLNLIQKRPVDPLPSLSHNDLLVRLQNGQICTTLSFPALNDKNTQPLDLVLTATWTLSDPRLFLREYALPRLSAQDAISSSALEAYLANRLRDWVADEIRSESYHDLQIDNIYPARWWEQMLPRWLDLKWITLENISTVSYQSPLAERMRECAKQKELMAAEQEAIHRQQNIILEREKETIRHQQALAALQAEIALDSRQRQERTELAKLEHQTNIIAAKENAGIARLAAEKQRAKLEFEIAKIRNNQSEAEALAKANADTARLAEETLEKLKSAQEEMAACTDAVKKAALEGIADSKRLADHVAGLSFSTLSLIGESPPRETLLTLAREKSAQSGNGVSLIKHDFVSRDIGSNRIEALTIGSALNFTLQSTRAGYVSILNIGTSGTVYLLTPNGLVPPNSAQTAAPCMTAFPGSPFFPIENLWENGPPGWEDMLVIVSDAPLFEPADLASASPSTPEITLTTPLLKALLSRLQALEPESWSAGLMGFLVSL